MKIIIKKNLALAIFGIGIVVSSYAVAEKRIALVIGNSKYSAANLPNLKNPKNDARDIAAVLKRQGFELVGNTVQLDLDRQAMLKRILEFGDQLGPNTVGLFYFSGHGLAMNKSNYMVPIDGKIRSKREVPIKLVAADHIINQFRETGGGLNIMILDACRNTPSLFRGLRSGSGAGLAEIQAASGTLISYATQPGNVALDGRGRNSPYATALIEVMQIPGIGVLQAFNQVSLKVKKLTNGAQVPWTTSVALEGDFFFAGRNKPVLSSQTASSKTAPDVLAWTSVQNTNNPDELVAFIQGLMLRLPLNQLGMLFELS